MEQQHPTHRKNDAASPAVPFRLVRSRRRTMALVVTLEGDLEVRVPHRAPLTDIHRMIERHRDWIDRKQSDRRESHRRRILLEEGAMIPVNGIPRRLAFGRASRSGVILRDDDIILSERFRANEDGCRRALSILFRRLALEKMEPLVHEVAKRSGLSVKSVRITAARRRWGSCSSRGSLNFSYRIAQAPHMVQYYLAVHEVAHLRHPNHSKQFWDLVARLMPDYLEAEAWLKGEGTRLPV